MRAAAAALPQANHRSVCRRPMRRLFRRLELDAAGTESGSGKGCVMSGRGGGGCCGCRCGRGSGTTVPQSQHEPASCSRGQGPSEVRRMRSVTASRPAALSLGVWPRTSAAPISERAPVFRKQRIRCSTSCALTSHHQQLNGSSCEIAFALLGQRLAGHTCSSGASTAC